MKISKSDITGYLSAILNILKDEKTEIVPL